jgi:hypothetical protein
MENEEGKVEVDELDLGFYLIHVFYIIFTLLIYKIVGGI